MKTAHALAQLLIALFCSAAISARAQLPASVTDALAKHQLSPTDVAIVVQPLDGTQTTLAHRADAAMNPASVMKLVTAFVALDRLGPARQWHSRFLATAWPQDGRLDGDLFVQGGGDPLLDNKRLTQLFQRLQKSGLKRIEGDLIIDDSVLALPAHDAAAFDQRPLRPYNSGAAGFLLNFNTLGLILLPGRDHQTVTVITEPTLAGIEIDNRLRSTKGACGIWHSQLKATLQAADQPQKPDRLRLSGSLPAACGQRHWGVAPYAPRRFARQLLQAQLAQHAITLDGQIRYGKTAANARHSLLQEPSPALAEIIREMNKWSSNVIARQLFALIGADANAHSTNAVLAAREASRQTLQAHQIDTSGLIIDNGSGLSRSSRISAHTLAAMLRAAWHKPWMPEYIAALPILGVDGTTARRLRNSAARGQAHLKTGAINHVRAIAGYVQDRYNRHHVVVMLVNAPNAAASRDAQHALLEWVHAGATPP